MITVFLMFFQQYLQKNANSLSMIPTLELLRRSDGLDNLGGHLRPAVESLSHRDKAVLNSMYQCSGEWSIIICDQH